MNIQLVGPADGLTFTYRPGSRVACVWPRDPGPRKPTLLEEAESAFEEVHDRAYWSDSNERPPRGHNKAFTDCNDPTCVRRRALLADEEA